MLHECRACFETRPSGAPQHDGGGGWHQRVRHPDEEVCAARRLEGCARRNPPAGEGRKQRNVAPDQHLFFIAATAFDLPLGGRRVVQPLEMLMNY
jgi:hypothetical protein